VLNGAIRSTVEVHRENPLFLEGPFRGQVNEGIQTTYDERGRYDELSDPKYTDTGVSSTSWVTIGAEKEIGSQISPLDYLLHGDWPHFYGGDADSAP